MSDDLDGLPNDPDRISDVAHPREADALLGCARADATFLAAWRAGRMHHAWLLRGPPGIGKATFAYRAARFVLSQPGETSGGLFDLEPPPPPETMDVSADHPIARQIRRGAHPDLRELRRTWNPKTKAFGKAISVDGVRGLIEAFQLSVAEGGWRVALIDPADDMNRAAANALLKLLEQPPPKTLFLLVAHAAGRLPATIASRCRRLDFRPLTPEDAVAAMRAAAPELSEDDARALESLAPGSPGDALRLHAVGGVGLYRDVVGLFAGGPRVDHSALSRLTRGTSGRAGAERFHAAARLIGVFVSRLAITGAAGAPRGASSRERAVLERLAPNLAAARIWAEAAPEALSRFDEAVELNLDPQRSILDIALYLEAQATRIARAAA